MSLLDIIPGWAQTKTAFYIAIGVGTFSIAVMAFWHYNDIINQLNTEKAKNITLSNTVDVQNGTIKTAITTINNWKDSQDKLIKAIADFNTNNQDAQKYGEKLDETFSKHDMQKLSLDNPSAIQVHINHGSDNVMRMLECFSDIENTDCSSELGSTKLQTGTTKSSGNKNLSNKMGSNN